MRLAGEAHLDSTIPLIVSKLAADGGDLLNEQCSQALSRIGTSAVLEAVAEAYPNSPHHFRLYASGPLESIHSDLAVEKCLHLLRMENDYDLRVNLAYALLSHFAPEGIEEARKLLLGRRLDFESQGLRNYLVETCTIIGERFPEYDEWQAAEKTEKKEHGRRVRELEGDPNGLLLFALEKLTGNKAADEVKTTPSVLLAPRQSLALKSDKKQKIGRNDPCPCGSGKKFKVCCLRKDGG